MAIDADEKIELSISVVNTSNWLYLQPCLESIIKNVKSVNYEILVVDNVSTDGSAAKIKQQFPHVVLSENTVRYGFAKNNNINIRKAKGEFIMLLNDDTLVLPDTIHKALQVFSLDPTIGVVGCKMISPDGTIQIASSRKFRTLLSEFVIETGLVRISPQIFIEPKSEITEIDVASEAGMIIRKTVIDQVGLLDEDFFMFGEGPEWCRRIKRKNWKIVYFESCPIIHFGGTTNKRTSEKMNVQFYKSTYLFFKKDKLLKAKIYKHMISTIVKLKQFVLRVLSFFSPRLKEKNRNMKPYYDTLLDYFSNRFDDQNYPFPT